MINLPLKVQYIIYSSEIGVTLGPLKKSDSSSLDGRTVQRPFFN